MSNQKIPNRSNFLEKFAAVESFLQNKTEQKSSAITKQETEVANSPNIITEIPVVVEQELKCNKCGSVTGPEDVFCGTCGNKLLEG